MAKTGKQTSNAFAELRPATLRAIGNALIEWYTRHRRDLPWRRTRDPYAVWVSEIMLQQTQVATVLPYYERWMQRFPNVDTLARAREEDVLHAWQGLGYYSRARNLMRGARVVRERHAGLVPELVPELLKLPGIGRYSAGAIASIAYGKAVPVVDGNVVRVLCRLFALSGNPARAPLNARLWEIAEQLLPQGRARDFNQSLMELGATVCTARRPKCTLCPLARLCAGYKKGLAHALPETAKRPTMTALRMVAALVWRKRRVLLCQLHSDAPRWAGMWLFPMTEVRAGETAEGAVLRAVRESVGLKSHVERLLAVVRHGVTRYRITLEAYVCRVDRGRARKGSCATFYFAKPEELCELAMPAAHRRIARRISEK